jgi:signal transduction histidine kinase
VNCVTEGRRAPRVEPIDVLASILVTAVLVLIMTTQIEPEPGHRSLDGLAVACIVAAGGSVALARRTPMATLVIASGAMCVYGSRGYPGGPVYLTMLVGMFGLSSARGPSRAWLPAAISTLAVVGASIAGGAGSENLVIHTLVLSWAAGAVLLGGVARSRRLGREALEERARYLAETREEEARRRVAEERVRIARDLHDSVAHSLASIAVQAGVGAHLLDQRPEEARAALVAIRRASGEALHELRSTLAVLRDGNDRVGAGAPRHPGPGLAELPALVEGSRANGLPIEVSVAGDRRPLPRAVDNAAYRIVQESLTNVLRHAGPARATVAIRYGDDAFEIDVSDDGVGVAGASGPDGHGLAGMRERVTLLGGTFDAGPGSERGFRVHALLPLEPSGADP